MFKKMGSREYGFFELFNRHAALVLEGTHAFVSAASTWPAGSGALNRIEEVEHECDSVAHMAIDLLHQSFITPLDRDEILRLVSRLDDIIDLVDSAARRTVIFELGPLPEELKEMAVVLDQAMAKVAEVVELLHGLKQVEHMRKLFREINQLENQGDTLMHRGLGKIFKNFAHEPLTVIKLKEVYETVEMAIDRCEDVANVVEGILLEHA